MILIKVIKLSLNLYRETVIDEYQFKQIGFIDAYYVNIQFGLGECFVIVGNDVVGYAIFNYVELKDANQINNNDILSLVKSYINNIKSLLGLEKTSN